MNERLREEYGLSRFVFDEAEARGWSEEQLAGKMGCDVEALAPIYEGHLPFTDELAAMLGKAFGTSAGLWMRIADAFDALAGLDERDSHRTLAESCRKQFSGPDFSSVTHH